jgi:putative addiction module component (TIGR02574 family)
MSRSLEQLEFEILNLSHSDRAKLAQRLLKSLGGEEAEDPNGVKRAWQEEIRRRLDAYHAGEVQTVPGLEVIEKAKGRLL